MSAVRPSRGEPCQDCGSVSWQDVHTLSGLVLYVCGNGHYWHPSRPTTAPRTDSVLALEEAHP